MTNQLAMQVRSVEEGKPRSDAQKFGRKKQETGMQPKEKVVK